MPEIYRKDVLGKRNVERSFHITFELRRPALNYPNLPLTPLFNSFAQQIE
jgi:hypothetical protein